MRHDVLRMPCSSLGSGTASAIVRRFPVYVLHWPGRAEVDPEFNRLGRKIRTLANRVVRIWIWRCALQRCKVSSSWRFIATKIDQNWSNADQRRNIGTLHHGLHLKWGVMRLMFKPHYDVLIDEQGIEIPAVQPIVTLPNSEHDKGLITARELIYKQGKDSYCLQKWLKVGLPCSMLNYDKNETLDRTTPIDGTV